MFVELYFTPYITTKHNNNNGMRHKTVWLDHTIDCNSIKTGSVVRETAAAVMIDKYRINLTFLLLFASFLCSLFFFVFLLFLQRRSGLPYDTVIDRRGIKQGCTVSAAAAAAAVTTTNAFEQHHPFREGYRTIIDKRGIDTDTAA